MSIQLVVGGLSQVALAASLLSPSGVLGQASAPAKGKSGQGEWCETQRDCQSGLICSVNFCESTRVAPIPAHKVSPPPPADGNVLVMGTLSAIGNGKVSIQTPSEIVTLKLLSGTKVCVNGRGSSTAALKVGTSISAFTNASGTGAQRLDFPSTQVAFYFDINTMFSSRPQFQPCK